MNNKTSEGKTRWIPILVCIFSFINLLNEILIHTYYNHDVNYIFFNKNFFRVGPYQTMVIWHVSSMGFLFLV